MYIICIIKIKHSYWRKAHSFYLIQVLSSYLLIEAENVTLLSIIIKSSIAKCKQIFDAFFHLMEGVKELK